MGNDYVDVDIKDGSLLKIVTDVGSDVFGQDWDHAVLLARY